MSNNKNRTAQLALQNTPIILFVVVFVIFGLLSPRFFAWQTFENIFKQASYIGIVAVGMTFVLLTAGIDLSVGSNMYLSAAVAALLMQTYHYPIWLAILVSLAVGLLFGTVNAILITRLHLIPFMATLGTMVAGKGLALLFTKSVTLTIPTGLRQLAYARAFGLIPVPIVIFAIVVAIAWFILTMTPLGRRIYAVGNDPESAKKAGIGVAGVVGTVYIISGLTAALGGIVAAAQQGVVIPGLGEGYEFNAIAAAVLGGTSLFGGVGSVFPGTVVGAVLIQMIQSGLVFMQVDIYVQPLITAGIIFFAVLLDSFRNAQLLRMRRRNIRVDKGTLEPAAGD
jgi:ribose/xylose/arabinose/galactoside ABC-type transport system permease subunit